MRYEVVVVVVGADTPLRDQTVGFWEVGREADGGGSLFYAVSLGGGVRHRRKKSSGG